MSSSPSDGTPDGNDGRSFAGPSPRDLSHLRGDLSQLMREMEDRAVKIVTGDQDRMRALLSAVMAVSGELGLETTLRRIIHAATT